MDEDADALSAPPARGVWVGVFRRSPVPIRGTERATKVLGLLRTSSFLRRPRPFIPWQGSDNRVTGRDTVIITKRRKRWDSRRHERSGKLLKVRSISIE